MPGEQHELGSLPVGADCDDLVFNVVRIIRIMTLTNTHQPSAVSARTAIGITMTRGRELSLLPGLDIEPEDLSPTRLVSEVELTVGHPPGAAAVFVHSRSSVHFGAGHLDHDTFAPAHDGYAALLARATLGPIDVVTVGMNFANSDRARDDKLGCDGRGNGH